MVTHRPALGVELLFHVRPVDACLDAGETRLLIDFQDLVHAAHVDDDDLTGLVGFGLRGGDDVGASAEGDDDCVNFESGVHDLNDLILGDRVDDDIRQTAELAGSDAHEVADALAVTAGDTSFVFDDHVLLTDGGDELLPEAVAELRGGDVEGGEIRGGGDLAVDVEADHLLHERCELGTTLVRVAKAFFAPAPPFLLLDSVDHRSSCCSAWDLALSASCVASEDAAASMAASRAYAASVLRP